MEQKVIDYDRMVAENERANTVLNGLHAEGVIEVDENGNVSPSKQKQPK